MPVNQFCEDLTRYTRWKTREVPVGNLVIGGDNPIRIQSMTTTDTMDTVATVQQSIRMIDAGCELIRVTAPSRRDAENLASIKKELRAEGFETPLIADIHFTPSAAEIAARLVEKIRINPGNYADRKKFEQKDYTDYEYAAELERIRDRFVPLVKICKEYGTAIRIGTNHGSLSDRIMNRYGDTPTGMVESAMEFIRICEEEDFHNIVLSMKASNPGIMVGAYRLLVAAMKDERMAYPLHLGVTEAGEGMDGRIKSSIGIGTLLEDGLGDTIRVSLTEEPENEIPVARELVERYSNRSEHDPIAPVSGVEPDWYDYNRRETILVSNVGSPLAPVVIQEISDSRVSGEIGKQSGYRLNETGVFERTDDIAPDYFYLGKHSTDGMKGLKIILDADSWENAPDTYPLFRSLEETADRDLSNEMNFLLLNTRDMDSSILERLKDLEKCIIILESDNDHWVADIRRWMIEFMQLDVRLPVILYRRYQATRDQLLLFSATDFGSLLLAGFGDGICIKAEHAPDFILSASYGILQATRTRISRAEFISCPSCGRTQFDLQETTEKIRTRTGHLKGVKIAIMGCIVNGPGEMADADYGYVGTGEGIISLYRGKHVVRKNIPAPRAVEALVDLIEFHGDWTEPDIDRTGE